ncbi:GNAT family N-acetyltransferase [Afifella sp. H1R]|uniref:GNAT family N-acetyltransferase n=1 Tax=Afifella sp. H1R TaxID=2908841 RepID=UPI001F21F499|nr:GNAT family N-acetyltransferase [Afifella sp. H1R]MCF1503406.1 GNAT family N-acetyltransferase [Afifella sp. H1R]
MSRLETERLILRPWQDSDRDFWADLNADPEVMRFFEKTRSRAESDAIFEKLKGHFLVHTFGFWVLERKTDGEPVGFAGLQHTDFEAPFTPAVEVGWRLKRAEWGKGYATEAATESLAYAFGPLALDEVISFTVTANVKSRRVMERIGMLRDRAKDFDHPRLPEDSALRRHVAYSITREAWQARQRQTA